MKTWTLSPRDDGSRLAVVVDDGRLAIVGPDGALGLEPGEAGPLALALRDAAAGTVDQLPPCRCVVCQVERAQGSRL